MISISELKELIQAKKVDTVVLCFPNIFGVLIGKHLDADYFIEDVVKSGSRACNMHFAINFTQEILVDTPYWSTGGGDSQMKPDFESIRIMGWMDKQVILYADIYDDSMIPVQFAPRNILKKQIKDAHDMGFKINCATELEYYAFEKTAKENYRDGYRNLLPVSTVNEESNILLNNRNEGMNHGIRTALKRSGLRVEGTKGELGIGQHEINIKYSDPLTTADNTGILKCCIKGVAEQKGNCVTFMAKPYSEQPGSSCHIHLSLIDLNGKNVFNGKDVLLDEEKDIWASKEMMYFLGGWMKYVQEVFVMYAPLINSYKRYERETAAPADLNTWSIDNRTTAFRILGTGESLRIEFRIPGADANPYFALAASLASGLAGIRNKIDPPAIFKGNAYYDNKSNEMKIIPATLDEALKIFGESEFAAEFLGKESRDHIKTVLYSEVLAYQKAITDFEYKRYFDQI